MKRKIKFIIGLTLMIYAASALCATAYALSPAANNIGVGIRNSMTYTSSRRLDDIFAIVTEPKDTYAKKGDKATISVEAAGEGLCYEWFVMYPNDFCEEGSWDSFGTNAATVQTPAVNDELWIKCVITNAHGKELTTRTAVVKPGVPLKITAQPQDAAALNDEVVSTTVKAQGTNLTYTWYVKDPGKTTFTRSVIGDSTYSYIMNEYKSGRQVYCIVKDDCGNFVQTRTATLYSSGPIVILGQPQDDSAPLGETVSATIIADGENLRYEWWYADSDMTLFEKSSVTKSTYSFTMTEAKNGRKVYCIIYDRFGDMVYTRTVTFRMGTESDGIEITAQPQSADFAGGEIASAKVAASGEGLKYTWYVKDPGKDIYVKSSITKDTYAFTMSAAKDGRKVYCVVEDANGNSVTSAVVTFRMTGSVVITEQPQSVTAAAGEKATIKVTATGEGLTYKWYYKNEGGSNFVYTSSFKTNTYSVEMTAARSGRQIYCVITDANGKSVKSDTVTLSMKTEGPVITLQPKDISAAAGENVTVTVGASGEGLTYEWYYRSKGDDGGFSYADEFESNTYSVKMTADVDGQQVFCIVTDKYGNYVVTDDVTLSMGASGPAITVQPKSITAAAGEKATVKITATGEGLTYKWYYKNKGGSGFNYTSSFTTNTYAVVMSEARSGRQIYCVVTDKNGNSVKSDTVTISMKTSGPVITAQPQSVTAAAGEKATVKVTATGEGLTYKWYYKNKGGSGFNYTSSFTTNTYAVVMSEARSGRQIYCVVTDKNGNSVKSDTVTISMS